MRRIAMALVLAVSLVALAAPVASATPPTSGTFHGAETIDLGPVCAFPVMVSYDITVTYTDFYLKGGKVREIGRQVETDVFTANGKTLVGNTYSLDYTALVSDIDWTTVYSDVAVGTLFSVTLPDGTRLFSTGYVDFLKSPGPWVRVDIGHNADFTRFCAYFG